jgi:hypothetical protein
MKWKSRITVEKTFLASRRIFWSCMLLIILAGSIGVLIKYSELTWSWLGIFDSILTAVIFLLLIVSWITPGILVILGTPQLVHAWLRGINPVGVRNKPWEELSDIERVLIYFWALLLPAFTLLAIVGFILSSFRK